ncbi:hypothetical protein EDD30_7564 [Couchioplanes caeruleus]|uniref:Uncharacterized protein n=1 Tax=Couchioplanes caeruleus TaxID=56438 RepID=A0A3N1GW20_9ACTN|nr:hypothetical protein EDD30_7564 [Couchioplanes caeruleus]
MDRLSGSQLIAVISDGSALPDGADLNPVLSGHARWLSNLGFDALTAALNTDGRDTPTVALSAVPGDVSVFHLVHTRAEHAGQIRQALEDAGRAVVTDNDLRAVVVAARVLTELRRMRRPTDQSAVVIVDIDELIDMGALLMAIGVRNLVFCRQADVAFPLSRATHDADVVVDLRPAPVHNPRTPGPTRPLVVPLPAPADSLAVLPGLLAALADTQAARLHVDVLAAVAQMLATTTAPGFALATLDPALTDDIAWAVRQALRHPRGG